MVRNLFLIRHAQALPQAKDERDFQRVLSDLGKKQAILLGDFLQKAEISFDAIFISPAKRTLETAQKINDRLDTPVKVIIAEEYYEATANTMVAVMTRMEDMFKDIIVIGHNPSISQLSEYLIGDGLGNFTTASCAWIEIELDSWAMITRHCGMLKSSYYPGQMVTE